MQDMLYYNCQKELAPKGKEVNTMDTKEKIIAMMEKEAINNGKTRKKKIAYYKGRYDTIKKIVLNLVEGMELTKDYLLHEVS